MLAAFLFYYEADQYLISAILLQEGLDVLCPKTLNGKLYLKYILYVPIMYVPIMYLTIKFRKLITRVNIPNSQFHCVLDGVESCFLRI